jgi:hydroxyethylthiazole kinase-like uncharacterized protein yjeF
MLNILSSDQTREADQYTIQHQPIASNDLMEQAASAFVDAFSAEYPYLDEVISVYCGTGNNGGDGLAIACLLSEYGYHVSVKIIRFSEKSTLDFDLNYNRIKKTTISVTEISGSDFPPENADVIIDAILGSGLNKTLRGHWELLATYINNLNKPVIAVDVPTGFPSEGLIEPRAAVVKADLVISFQRTKINFFLPESSEALKRFEVVDIGLDEGFIQSLDSRWKLIEKADILKILKPRKAFSHKGSYGHALIIAGAKETMGAALLCAEACLHTGAGLTTACIPADGLTALNTYLPEVMALLRSEERFSLLAIEKYNAVGAGPGLGTNDQAINLIRELLNQVEMPLVLDADGLNILATKPEWLKDLLPGTVITPHLKEFDRLFGTHNDWWSRLEKASEQAARFQIYIVLKNRYTFIIAPDKQIYCNPTGSPAMASGGMGDVLTGMIVSFMAQGYDSLQASILAVYIHGLCGEKAKGNVCTASELAKSISKVVKKFLNEG